MEVGGLRVLRALLIGQMGNSFLPARLGDVGRAVLLAPHSTGGLPAILGTILAEKALDGVLGLLLLMGLALWIPLPHWLRGSILMPSLLTAGLLALLLLSASRRERVTDLMHRLLLKLPALKRAPCLPGVHWGYQQQKVEPVADFREFLVNLPHRLGKGPAAQGVIVGWLMGGVISGKPEQALFQSLRQSAVEVSQYQRE